MAAANTYFTESAETHLNGRSLNRAQLSEPATHPKNYYTLIIIIVHESR